MLNTSRVPSVSLNRQRIIRTRVTWEEDIKGPVPRQALNSITNEYKREIYLKSIITRTKRFPTTKLQKSQNADITIPSEKPKTKLWNT